MLVCFNKGKSYCFKECGNGLYYLEIYDPEIVPLTAKDTVSDYYFLSTVDEKIDYFTPTCIEGLDRTHDLQHFLGRPSNKQLIIFLGKNLIINFLVLLDDVRHSRAIYDSAVAILKGKTVRNKPKHIEFKKCIPIQPDILKNHTELPLYINYCFINRHPYLTTIIRKENYQKIQKMSCSG